MLRRIVSFGQQVYESEDALMAPPAFDGPGRSDSKSGGGLASVLKNLTGTKSTKPPTSSGAAGTPGSSLSPATLTPAMGPMTGSTLSVASSSLQADSVLDPLVRHYPDMTYTECVQLLHRSNNHTNEERTLAAYELAALLADSPTQSAYDVWLSASDLTDADKPQRTRDAGWRLLAQCARHSSQTNLERKEYFEAITGSEDPVDFHAQLVALIDLTSNGRDLSGFEYELLPVLTRWFSKAYDAKKQSRQTGTLALAEKNLAQLFLFTCETLRRSSKIASNEAMAGLLYAVLHIATHTNTEQDLLHFIAIIDTCMVIGAMPNKALSERCVLVLVSIYCEVQGLAASSWKVLANILKSHHGSETLALLLDTLRNFPIAGFVDSTDGFLDIRGALAVLQKLAHEPSDSGFPEVPYALMVEGLANIADKITRPRVSATVLQFINSLFDSSEGNVCPLILDEDWGSLLAVASVCVKRASPAVSFDTQSSNVETLFSGPGLTGEKSMQFINRESACLCARIESLLRGPLSDRLEHSQRTNCINFLADSHEILLDSGADLVLKHFNEYHCCLPSDPRWAENLHLVLDAFYSNQKRSASIRHTALQTAIDVRNVLELVDGTSIEAPGSVNNLSMRILARLGEERDSSMLLRAAAFAVSIAPSSNADLFSFIMESLASVVQGDVQAQALVASAPQSPVPMPSPASPAHEAIGLPTDFAPSFAEQSTSNIAARSYVQIFMDTMNADAAKAIAAFDALVLLAQNKSCPVDARLSAMKLLFRLRADWTYRVFLVSNTESDGLAAVLHRTGEFQAENAHETTARQAKHDASAPSMSLSAIPIATRPSRGLSLTGGSGMTFQDRISMPNRTASGTSRHRGLSQHYLNQWVVPDQDALPQKPIETASTVLYSHQWDTDTTEADQLPEPSPTAEFNIPAAEAASGAGLEPISPTHVQSPASPPVEQGQEDETVQKDQGAKHTGPRVMALNMEGWMNAVLDVLTKTANWEVYSFVLVHLPSQLSNHAVCHGAIPAILRIRAALCEQIHNNNSQEPPVATKLKRSDVQTCVLQTLTMILSYHEYFQRKEEDELVHTFITGLTEKNPISCVHALSICCYELPNATGKFLVQILTKMASIITRPNVAVHILELLACLSRLPWLYSNFRDGDYRIAFGVCFRYLQAVREGRFNNRPSFSNTASSTEQPKPAGSQPNANDDLPQYVYALAYHVLTFWFLALRVTDRASYVNWITGRLFSDSISADQFSEEQAQITLDFMQRVAFTDTDESSPITQSPDGARFAGAADDFQSMRNWVVGNSILTMQPGGKPGYSRVTKRQPSGTSYYMIMENTKSPPPHQTRGLADLSADGPGSSVPTLFPSHLLAQLLAPPPQPVESPLRPILLPVDDAVERAFKTFDRNSTIDGHKVGVIYIGEGQTDETEILANISGSSDYVEFLNGLGTLTRLKGATFNTQGLDREFDSDGAYTFCWRDRVTEMVFHVITQMPTDREHDPICINKKRHIGNDYVNIIFNDSGLPFRFDTFPSEFNYVYIVITPESRASFVARRELSLQEEREAERESMHGTGQAFGASNNAKQQKRAMPFYKVHVMVKPGFPEISPAARAKIISLKALPDFIRLLALNASVFSQVWAHRQGGEHISPWRNRLRQIKRLRERYGPAVSGATGAGPIPVAPSPTPPPTTTTGTTGPSSLPGSNLLGGGALNSGVSSLNGMSSTERLSRPAMAGISTFNSLRRASVAQFFPTAADSTSGAPGAAGVTPDNLDGSGVDGGADAFLKSVDFSSWS